jgi:hypothetical protein
MTPLDRRQLLQSLAAAGGVALGVNAGWTAPAARQKDLIRLENQQPGTTDWQLTYTRVDPATKYRSPLIEGYVSHASVQAGDRLEFFVSVQPESPVTIDVYRLGYYQGKGGRFMTRIGPVACRPQETPGIGKERLRECEWTPTAALDIPKDWVSD